MGIFQSLQLARPEIMKEETIDYMTIGERQRALIGVRWDNHSAPDSDKRQPPSFHCVCVCLFVRLRISPPRIKLAALYFARQFIGVQGRESPIFVNFAPQKPKIRRIGQRAGHAHPHVNITVEMCRRKCHARKASFVKSHGMWTLDRHVWIYVRPRRRTYLLNL